MEELRIRCDRCGREITEKKGISLSVSAKIMPKEAGKNEGVSLFVTDCCPHCVDSALKHVSSWINRYKKGGTE